MIRIAHIGDKVVDDCGVCGEVIDLPIKSHAGILSGRGYFIIAYRLLKRIS